MKSARAIQDTVLILAEHTLEGKMVVETTCTDYDEWKALPNAITYKGVQMGKTGWSSDTDRACYKEGAAIADGAVSRDWVLTQLAGMSFHTQGSAYDYMRKCMKMSDRIFECGMSERNRPTITIHRKPSQIPYGIDSRLIELSLASHMDGPNNRVTYEFLLPEKFPEGEKFLTDCGWEKIT